MEELTFGELQELRKDGSVADEEVGKLSELKELILTSRLLSFGHGND